MKNLKTYGIIALMLGIGSIASAQVKNYFGLWLEGGEWSLLTKESAYKNSTGVAGAAGVLYDMQAGHFLLDLGVGARYGLTSFNQSIDLAPIRLIDQVGINGQPHMTYIYDIQQRKDKYTDLSLQVPVLLGGQWGRFYLLGGVKPRLSLMAKARTQADITTSAEYYAQSNQQGGMLWAPFYNVPASQLYSHVAKEAVTKSNFKFDLDASVEIGARLGFMTGKTGWDVPKTRTQYRLALFADYGLVDLYPGIKNDTHGNPEAAVSTPSGFSPDRDMIGEVKFNNIMSTPEFLAEESSKPHVNNLLIGVKLTVLFELPKKGVCVVCNDPYHTLPHRSTTPRQYRGKIAK